MNESNPILEFQEVTKVYGESTVAIEDISFEVEEGTTTVLVGPSGCGKTTTLELVNRLVELTEGKILYQGQDIQDLDKIEYRRNLGYVIQEIGLFDHMTVGENVGIVPKLKSWKPDRIDERVDELLEMVDLTPAQYRDQHPTELSGGQRQRVGVARALAADPDLLLMDEPFGALDPITREKIQDEFLQIQKEINKTILFVTHDMNEALKMGDMIALYNEGNLVQYATPEELLSNPNNEFVESFIGEDRMLKKLQVAEISEGMDTNSEWVGRDVSELSDEEQYFARDDEGNIVTIAPDVSAQNALIAIYERNGTPVLVTEGGEIVGIASEEAIKNMVKI